MSIISFSAASSFSNTAAGTFAFPSGERASYCSLAEITSSLSSSVSTPTTGKASIVSSVAFDSSMSVISFSAALSLSRVSAGTFAFSSGDNASYSALAAIISSLLSKVISSTLKSIKSSMLSVAKFA